MKKPIIILLLLLLTSASLFATDAATINVSTLVEPTAIFGVTFDGVDNHSFGSLALFQSKIFSSLETEINMVNLYNGMQIAFLAGINNTKSPVTIDITISDLVSGDNAVALTVSPTQATIPAASNNSFGILKNARINIKEAVRGRSRVAPAGDYKATITFALTT